MRRLLTTATMICLLGAGASVPSDGVAEVGPVDDAGPDIVETDVGDVSEDATDTGTDATDDVAVDADDAATTAFRYFGTVELVDRSDDSGTTVTLTQIDGSATGMTTTGADGGFEITGLPSGQYRAEFAADGYVGLTEEFQLDADRVVSRTLYTDQSVQLEATIIFGVDDSEAAAPSTVSPVLDGPRGRITPDAPITVENGQATWSVQDLGVGSWTLSVEAEGFESASIPFDVDGDGGAQRVRLEIVPESIPDTEPTGGCTVGPGQNPRSPMSWLMLGFGLVLLRLRRQRDA